MPKTTTRNTQQLREIWAGLFQPLVGRTIKSVRWMTEEEAESCGFERSPVVITLDDETMLFPSMDDEGSGAGALFVQAGTKTRGIPEGAPVI